MKVAAWWYVLEAAPTVDDTLCHHAHPDLALGLELFAVAALRLGASRLVVLACVLGAVAC